MRLIDDDPGSLDRLHDIVVLPPVPWWPPAPAWYVVGAFASLLVVLTAWWLVSRWRRDRYRRAGLSELVTLERKNKGIVPVSQLASLVKRVALVAFPRETVASLSGPGWLGFLDRTGCTEEFTRGPGVLLEAGYRRDPSPASADLLAVVRRWIQHHRTDLPC